MVCRGSKNEELSKYGKAFRVIPHETKEGLFILIGDNIQVVAPKGDENIVMKESDEDLPLDIDFLSEDNKDANIEEIDSSYFRL